MIKLVDCKVSKKREVGLISGLVFQHKKDDRS